MKTIVVVAENHRLVQRFLAQPQQLDAPAIDAVLARPIDRETLRVVLYRWLGPCRSGADWLDARSAVRSRPPGLFQTLNQGRSQRSTCGSLNR